VYLSARDGTGQHELYRGDDGYASPIWLPDESRLAVSLGAEAADRRVGAGDGSDLRPLASDDSKSAWANSGVMAWAPGSRGYLYLRLQTRGSCGSCMSLSTPVLQDVMSERLSDGANDGPPVNLTNFAPGQYAVAAAWSPDGQTLAFLRKTFDPTGDWQGARDRLAKAPVEVWLRDASGVQRQLPGVTLPDSGRIHWSPDGKRLAIEAGNGLTGPAASIDTYVVAADGSAHSVLRDARSVVWSPDGTELAFIHRTGPTDLGDGVTPASLPIEVVGADGSARRQVAVATGDPDAFHILWATN
jgi:Tol biopolymer transport system component